MVWARIDDEILDNPKIAKVGPIGLLMHVAGITWSCRNLRDGFLPTSAARTLVDFEAIVLDYIDLMREGDGIKRGVHESLWGLRPVGGDDVADTLVEAGLWEKVDGGYQIHDFLKYNPSREEVLSKRDKERDRKRTERQRDGKSERSPNGTWNGIHPHPDPDPQREHYTLHAREAEPEAESETRLVPATPRPSLAPTPRLIDPKLEIDEGSREAAKQIGIQEIDVQWRRFVEKSIAKGELSCDFQALFRSRLSFIRNDERDARERAKRNGPRAPDGPVDRADPYHDPKELERRNRAGDRAERKRMSEAVPISASAIAVWASGAPQAPVVSAKIAKPVPRSLTPEELEERRRAQLEAAAKLDTPKAEGGAQ